MRPVVPRAVKGQRGAMRGQYVQENPPRFIPTGKPYFNSPLNFFTIKLGGIGKMRNFALQKANETGKLPE